jgi:hypothetical protein
MQSNYQILLCFNRLFSFLKNVSVFFIRRDIYINVIKINFFINFFRKKFIYYIFDIFICEFIIFLIWLDCICFFLKTFFIKSEKKFFKTSLLCFKILKLTHRGSSPFKGKFLGFLCILDLIFFKKNFYFFLKSVSVYLFKFLKDFLLCVYLFRYFVNHYVDRLVYHKSIYVSNWRTVKWRWRKRANAATFINSMSRKGNLINTWRYWILLNHHWYFIIRFFRFPRIKFWVLYRFSKKPLIFHYYDDGVVFYQLRRKFDDIAYFTEYYVYIWEINWFFFFGF